MGYDLASRKRLGRTVRDARRQAGYEGRAEFADKVGRSARQVQALENGEDGVGPDTYAAVAKALGWPLDRIYQLLDGDAEQVPTPPALTAVSDDQLVAEVLRRLKVGDGDVGRDASAIDEVGRRRRPREDDFEFVDEAAAESLDDE